MTLSSPQDCETKSLSFFIQNIYKPGDVLHLLHIIHEPSTLHMWTGQIIPPDESAEMEQVEEAKHFVAQRFVKTLVAHNISFKLHVILGSTESPAIAGHIVTKAVDIMAVGIVMAKHTKKRMQEFVIGSVTNEVVKRAATGKCAVIIVPSQYEH